MKKKILLILLATLSVTGCSTISTKKAEITKDPKGIRVFPQRVYIFVDAEQKRSVVHFFPDHKNAYDIKPIAFLSKNKFEISLGEAGHITSLKSELDATDFIDFLEKAAEEAAKVEGSAVSARETEATYGLKSGIYRLDDDGILRSVSPK